MCRGRQVRDGGAYGCAVPRAYANLNPGLPLMIDQLMQQDAICYQWFQQRLTLSVCKPSISQWSQIKEDTVEPSVLARDINL